jgi:hypothetical protein
MVKKVFVNVCAVDTNGITFRCKKIEVSKTSKMDIANLFVLHRDFIKEKGCGAKLKEFHIIFDEGV